MPVKVEGERSWSNPLGLPRDIIHEDQSKSFEVTDKGIRKKVDTRGTKKGGILGVNCWENGEWVLREAMPVSNDSSDGKKIETIGDVRFIGVSPEELIRHTN